MCEEFGIDIPELPDEQIDRLREVLVAKSGLSPEQVSECRSSINFDNQIFHDEVNLVGMVFPASFHGDHARFIEGVTFTGSVFLGVTYLPNTSISQCNIRDCLFYEFVNISNARIGNLDASGASFSKGLYCLNTIIGGCHFGDAKFDSHLNISFSEFKIPPSFHGAILCDLVEIDGVKWPPVPKERENALQHAKNYESLRRHISKLNMASEETQIIALEMEARRRFERGIFLKLMYSVYGGLCGYGYSFERVVSFWIIQILLGAVTILLLAKGSTLSICKGSDVSLPEVAALSFSNSHPFLGLDRSAAYSLYAAHSDCIRYFDVIWGLQAVFGSILFFMILLTLRNRLRMR